MCISSARARRGYGSHNITSPHPKKTLSETPIGITQHMLYFLIAHLYSSCSTMTLGLWTSGQPSIFSPISQPHHLTRLFHHKAATLFPPATLYPSHLSFVVLLSAGEVRTGPSDNPGQGLAGEDQGCELPDDSAKSQRRSSAVTETHTET